MLSNLSSQRTLRQIKWINQILGNSKTSFKLNQNINKIELILVDKFQNQSSCGLKKFWKNNLPTLKFHNEKINFVLKRIFLPKENDDKIVKIASKINVYNNDNTVQNIGCECKESEEILKELVLVTQATPVAENEIQLLNENFVFSKESVSGNKD